MLDCHLIGCALKMIGQTTHHQILLRSRAVTNTLAPPGLQQELGTRAVARS